MISGETEHLLGQRSEAELYDNFLFFGKKKNRKKRKENRKMRKAARRSRRAMRIKKPFADTTVGQTILGMGGAQGIGQTIDTFIQKPTYPSPDTPQDYQLGVGATAEKQETDPEKKPPYLVYGIAAVVGLSTLAFMFSRQRSNY